MPLITRNSQNANVKLGTTAQLAALTFTDGDLASDTTLNKVKVFNGVSLAEIGATSFSSSAVVSQSTTIGDYTTPSDAEDNNTTIIDNFTTYSSQAAADLVWVSNNTTKVRVNITNDDLDYTFNVGDTFLSISRDLTSASNTTWLCRFKLKFSTLTTGNVNAPFMDIGLSSTQNTQQAAAVNRIYLRLKFDTDDKKFGGMDTFNSGISEDDGDDPQAFEPVISTDYFFEIVRNSSTTYTIKRYSDSTYATVSQTSSGTCDSGLTSLRYFNISTHAGGTPGNITGTFDTFKFYNGVTSPTIDPDLTIDDNTTTKWYNASATNPFVYVDMGSTSNLCGIAFFYDGINTTETEIKIQSSIDSTTWTDRRTITTSNLTNGAYNFYRFNVAGGARYIRIYGNSGSSVILSIYEIKILSKTDSQIFNDLGILTITASDTTLGADGT